MTREEFLRQLREGLSGLSGATRDEIVADYESHFDAAADAGRSEAEVAAALGDPRQLARELKLEAGIRNWHESRSPRTAWGAVLAFIGLGAIDILILLPLIFPVLGVVIGFYAAAIGLFIAGGGIMAIGPFTGFPGGGMTAVLVGLGCMAGAVALAALISLFAVWLVNALLRFGRLHYRVIKPALDPLM
jgi:uncharacterized membrane protein